MSTLLDEIKQTCYITGLFNLRSGEVSDHYFDKYRLESNPGLLSEICYKLANVLPKNTDIVAGIELGSVALATGVSLITKLPLVIVRKERKEYGTRNIVEGTDVNNKNVCLTEDIITTGTQVMLSANYLRETRARVNFVACIGIQTQSYEERLLQHGLIVEYLVDLNGMDHVSR